MLTARDAIALVLAITADAIQIACAPLFAVGALSPFDDGLDLAIFLILWKLLGWHRILLPSFATELVPVVDLCPTWTLAVLIILWRKRAQPPQPTHSTTTDSLISAPPPGPVTKAVP